MLVLGAGDVCSAVAHLLFTEGHRVVLHDGPAPPAAPRRDMAFADAFFDGQASLAGVTVNRVGLFASQAAGAGSPFLIGTVGQALADTGWHAVVDAQMSKQATPEDARANVELLIGLSPGFVAGDNCYVAVEKS